MAKNKHKIPKFGQKSTFHVDPQEKKARKACQKAMIAIRRVVFALTSQTKAQARIISRTKAKERTTKEKGKEGTYPQSGFSASETPNEKLYGHAWESDDWSAMGLTIPGLQILGGFAQKLTLHGWRYPL